MKDEDSVTKTINEGNVDIHKFPASKVRQLAKKMESSKATAKHIRQVAGDLPVTQIQLMHHQCMELLTGNYIKWKKMTKQKVQNHRPTEPHASRKPFDLWKPETQSNRCIRCGDTIHTKGFQCLTRRTNRHQTHLGLENLRHTNFEQGPYTPIKMVTVMFLMSQILMNHSVYRSKYRKHNSHIHKCLNLFTWWQI